MKLMTLIDRFGKPWTINPKYIIAVTPANTGPGARIILYEKIEIQIEVTKIDEFISQWIIQ